MFYLIWALINTGIFIFFIAICFKATKLIREKFGLFTSIVFVFGLLSFVGSVNSDSNENKSWKFNINDSLESTLGCSVILNENLISKNVLNVGYITNENSGLNTPKIAYASTIGWISGTQWIPITIFVNKTNNNFKFEYQVTAMIKWKLLGVTLYSQGRSYDGLISLKK